MKRILFFSCVFVLVLWSVSASAFDEPGGTYVHEFGGELALEYMGEGMVSVTLSTEMCRFNDSSGASGTFDNHGITARNDMGEVVMVIFYEKDYAVVYADFNAMAAYCTEYNDATGYYQAR